MQSITVFLQVKNFEAQIWEQHNLNIIYEGNRHKFSQNLELNKALLATRGTTLAEASPRDKVYGIGLSANNPRAQNRETWKGKNLLGEALTKLRDEILES